MLEKLNSLDTFPKLVVSSVRVAYIPSLKKKHILTFVTHWIFDNHTGTMTQYYGSIQNIVGDKGHQ